MCVRVCVFSQLADEMNLRARLSSPLLHAVFLFPGVWKEGLEIGTAYEEQENYLSCFSAAIFGRVELYDTLHAGAGTPPDSLASLQ